MRMAEPVLWAWPAATHVGMTVPKERFARRPGVGTGAREALRDDVESILWVCKLAPGTVNVPASPGVPEIQVFQIRARQSDVPARTLELIDRAIPLPVVFEVLAPDGDSVRYAAALQSGPETAPRHTAFFSTDWLPVETERSPLPASAGRLGDLYVRLLAPLLPVDPLPGENAETLAARATEYQQADREVAALTQKMRAEKQFKRRVELRHALQDAQTRRDKLR